MARKLYMWGCLWLPLILGVALFVIVFYIVDWSLLLPTTSMHTRALRDTLEDNNVFALEEFLRNNGNPNCLIEYVPQSWATPLHLAAIRGHLRQVRMLLDAGANPNGVCSEGRSPLGWAAATIPNPKVVDCAKLLLERGADPNARKPDGESILHSACYSGDPQDLEIAKLLINHGADVNAVTHIGNTPLHILAEGRPPDSHRLRIEVAKLLLEHGADAGIRNKFDETPFDIAWKSNCMEMIELLPDVEKKGASSTSPRRDGRGPQ